MQLYLGCGEKNVALSFFLVFPRPSLWLVWKKATFKILVLSNNLYMQGPSLQKNWSTFHSCPKGLWGRWNTGRGVASGTQGQGWAGDLGSSARGLLRPLLSQEWCGVTVMPSGNFTARSQRGQDAPTRGAQRRLGSRNCRAPRLSNCVWIWCDRAAGSYGASSDAASPRGSTREERQSRLPRRATDFWLI